MKLLQLYRYINSPSEWEVLKPLLDERDHTGWFLDWECSRPAPEALVERWVRGIYTEGGWNVAPPSYPALVSLDIPEATIDPIWILVPHQAAPYICTVESEVDAIQHDMSAVHRFDSISDLLALRMECGKIHQGPAVAKLIAEGLRIGVDLQ